MTEQQQPEPARIDDHLQPPADVSGTSDGAPTTGRELDEQEHDEAVTPDDNAFEVDGPQAGHA